MDADAVRRDPAAGGPARALLVLVHGLTGSGDDLVPFAPALQAALPHAALVAPHAPDPFDGGPTGRQWFSLQDRRPEVLLAGVTAATGPFDRFLDAELVRLGLPADALALLGFSQGAMMVLHAGLRRPVPPRAVLAYAGALLAPGELPGTNPPPVLLVHGEADEVVPVNRSRIAERQLRAAGVPVEALYLPGLGHSIDQRGLEAGIERLRRAFPDAANGE